MGTRSITKVLDTNGQTLICMYAQFDGYPSGHGKALLEFCKGMKIVNGISGGAKAGTHANGMECFAIQLLTHFKKGIGGFYLYPTDTKMDECDAEFEYRIRQALDLAIAEVWDEEVKAWISIAAAIARDQEAEDQE